MTETKGPGPPPPTDFNLPKELEFIADSVAPALAELSPLLKDFQDSEERVRFLSENFGAAGDGFLRCMNSRREGDDLLNLETAIRLFGARNAQDLLLAIRLREAIERREFDGEMQPAALSRFVVGLIPYAHSTRDHFGADSRYQWSAFLSGLVVDVILAVGARQKLEMSRPRRLFEERHKQVLAFIEEGLKEGRKGGGPALEKHLVSLVVMHSAGQVVLSMLNADYGSLLKSIEAKGFSARFLHLAEEASYGITSNQIGCFLCKLVTGLEPISPALLFYDYPFMLDDRLTRKDLHELVSFCTGLGATKKAA